MPKPCAFCRYHRRRMTVQQVKGRECLNKDNTQRTCRHLEKLTHQWWEERERMKLLRKERKKKLYECGI